MAYKTSAALLAAIVSMAGPALAQENAPATPAQNMETTAEQAVDSAAKAAGDAMTDAANDAATAVTDAANDAAAAMDAATTEPAATDTATDATATDATSDAGADDATMDAAADGASDATMAETDATTDATTDTATDAAADAATDQAADQPADATAEAAPAAATDPAEMQVGTYYVKSTHGDWTLRCIKADQGQPDPCELYQLLKDDQGNSVAEVTLIPLSQGEAAAGATVVAPLETDLVRGLGLKIDSSAPRGYPFNFCAPVGCVSRMGFDNAGLNSLKRGNVATVSLLPFGADPKNAVELPMSLTGFTAAFTELEGITAEARAQMDAAEPAPANN